MHKEIRRVVSVLCHMGLYRKGRGVKRRLFMARADDRNSRVKRGERGESAGIEREGEERKRSKMLEAGDEVWIRTGAMCSDDCRAGNASQTFWLPAVVPVVS